MDQEIIVDAIKHNTAQQSRIADAMEEVLRLVKEDQDCRGGFRLGNNSLGSSLQTECRSALRGQI